MQNDFDLSHINRQMKQNSVDIAAARQQAQNQRMMSDQMRRDGNDMRAVYYEQEADRFEQQANEHENANEELRTAKERTEKRISELEDRRAFINAAHASQLSQIDKELSQLRGSGMML